MPDRHWDDDAAAVERMAAHMRGERLPSSDAVHTDLAHLERLSALAAKAAGDRFAEHFLTKQDAVALAEEASKRAIQDTLWSVFGVEPGNLKDQERLRNDLSGIRDAYELRKAVLKHGVMAMVGVLGVGIITVIVMGIRSFFAGKGAP